MKVCNSCKMTTKLGKVKETLDEKVFNDKKMSECVECGDKFENDLDQKVCSFCQELLDGFLGDL